MKCLNCGNEILDSDSKFCNMCGAKLPSKKLQCSACGKIVEGDAEFCKYCGASLDGASEILVISEEKKEEVIEVKDNKPPKKLRLIALLGFLLSFSPYLFLPTHIASIIFSIITLNKVAKLKKENPDISYKKQKVFGILGIIISTVLLLGIIAIYILIFFFDNIFLSDLFNTMPKFFI